MATTNKDFKVKYGLIVEGASATVNGNQVLTEDASDQYILNLIGGETLVKSVSDEFIVSGSGELSLDRSTVDAYYDAEGSAAQALADAEDYTDARETAITTAYQSYADDAEADAISSANSYTDGRETAITTAYQNYADQAETDAKAYTDTRETAITTAYQNYADTAEQDAKDYADSLINDASAGSTNVWSAYKTQTEIGLAQSAAESYADGKVADLVSGAPELLDTLNELAAALEDNPDVIADLRDIADGKQNTLSTGNGIIIDGNNMIYIPASIEGGLSVTPTEVSIDRETVDEWYDAKNSASTVQGNLENHADDTSTHGVTGNIVGTSDSQTLTNKTIDGSNNTISNIANGSLVNDSITINGNSTALGSSVSLNTDDVSEGAMTRYFTDTRAKTSAAELLTGAIKSNITITGDENGLTITAEDGIEGKTTDDLEEGDNNLYFTDERALDAISGEDIYPNAVVINNLTKQVAGQITVATAGIATGLSWAKAEYRSAELVVKVAYGDHTEISKVLLTLDVNDNIAITEYGNVTTNGSASSISADISGADVRVRVTTVNNNSQVTVLGTLIA